MNEIGAVSARVKHFKAKGSLAELKTVKSGIPFQSNDLSARWKHEKLYFSRVETE